MGDGMTGRQSRVDLVQSVREGNRVRLMYILRNTILPETSRFSVEYVFCNRQWYQVVNRQRV